MSGGFKRSGIFGLVGVFIVAAMVAAIALTMGQGEANPKPALALIFGVIAVLAVAPIDAVAVRARDEAWNISRRSLRLAMLVTDRSVGHLT